MSGVSIDCLGYTHSSSEISSDSEDEEGMMNEDGDISWWATLTIVQCSR